MTEDMWRRVEEYIDWKAYMAITATQLNVAIRALNQAEFGLAGLKTYPKLNDGALRLELTDHEYRLEEIRDMLVKMQAQLRKDAQREFAGQTNRMEGRRMKYIAGYEKPYENICDHCMQEGELLFSWISPFPIALYCRNCGKVRSRKVE